MIWFAIKMLHLFHFLKNRVTLIPVIDTKCLLTPYSMLDMVAISELSPTWSSL